MSVELVFGSFVAVTLAICAAVLWSGVVRWRRLDDVKRQLGGLAKPVYEKSLLKGIRVQCPTSLAFAIRPEDEQSARMRRAGELREIQTGDFGFDAKYYLECEDTRVGDWLRRDDEARHAVAALVGRERTLELRRGRLTLGAYDLVAAGGSLRDLAEQLNRLADRLPRTEGADPATASSRRRLLAVRVVSSVTLLVGLAAVAVAWSDPALNPYPQHVRLRGLLVGAGLVGAALATPAYWLALNAVRGTSHAPRLASELFVMIWIPIVGTTMIGAHQYNLKSIAGEEHVEVTRVAGLPEERGRRSMRYYVMLPALDNGRIPAARYRSTRQINESLQEHQPARVRWREGKLASFLLLGPPEPVNASPSESK